MNVSIPQKRLDTCNISTRIMKRRNYVLRRVLFNLLPCAPLLGGPCPWAQIHHMQGRQRQSMLYSTKQVGAPDKAIKQAQKKLEKDVRYRYSPIRSVSSIANVGPHICMAVTNSFVSIRPCRSLGVNKR
ncbi:hypothetical protein BRADI_2g01055v3 [Brachypodium distachyon]|uniref:Uncharacterized protein n=1 Tax=Brachypodium distachyon TaxID=15368 RepID=A0A0Q3JV76_BRADI|nr:hypothetical protein BRADI_2g01055v3 [Brachypodium distachyon]